jgi:hypothetical protein
MSPTTLRIGFVLGDHFVKECGVFGESPVVEWIHAAKCYRAEKHEQQYRQPHVWLMVHFEGT